VGILYEERLRRQDEEVHVTPRAPPGSASAVGMADVGKPSGVIRVGDAHIVGQRRITAP